MAAHHILAGTDFSKTSEGAIRVAGDYARALGAKVTIAHVYPPMIFAQHPGIVDKGDTGKQTQLDAERGMIDSLERLRDDLLRGVPNVELQLLAHTRTADALCEYAQQHDVDLLVVAPQGTTGLAQMLIGSVAETLTRHAPVPVLVAR